MTEYEKKMINLQEEQNALLKKLNEKITYVLAVNNSIAKSSSIPQKDASEQSVTTDIDEIKEEEIPVPVDAEEIESGEKKVEMDEETAVDRALSNIIRALKNIEEISEDDIEILTKTVIDVDKYYFNNFFHLLEEEDREEIESFLQGLRDGEA